MDPVGVVYTNVSREHSQVAGVKNPFQEYLKAPVLLLGYGLSTDNIHSPNEKFHLSNFWRGARTSAILMEEAAR